jgi:hypothetical protein
VNHGLGVVAGRGGGRVDRAEFRARARSLDARLQRLSADYEQLLAGVREAVDGGNALLDPDGTLDERLDLICFQLATTGSVFTRVEVGDEDGPANCGGGGRV